MKHNILLALSFIILALLLSIHSRRCLADENRISFVSWSSNDSSPIFSSSYRYVVREELAHGVRFAFLAYRFDRASQSFRRMGRLLEDANQMLQICSVNNAGLITLFDWNSASLYAYSSTWKLISQTTANGCPDTIPPKTITKLSQHALAKTSRSDLQKMRNLLCTVPADEQFNVGNQRYRVYDILALRARLPGGAMIADVVTQPHTAAALMFGSWGNDSDRAVVLFKRPIKSQNYCVPSAISSSKGNPGCALQTNERSAFFWGLRVPAISELQPDEILNCSLTIAQRNPTALEQPSVDFLVEWMRGEYGGVGVMSRFSAPLSRQSINLRHFSLNLNTECGYVIRPSSTDGKLRHITFGLGNMWCSHY